MKRFIGVFARNRVFANILLSILIIGGLLSIYTTIREIIPEVRLDFIIVSVIWPGGDPEEIEEGINRKIEDALDGLSGINMIMTTAAENVASAIIEVKPGMDVIDLKDRVENAVDGITGLPSGSERPIVERLDLGLHVMLVGLSCDAMSYLELKRWADRVKVDLQNLKEVSRVDILGSDNYEISIEVSEAQLRKYGISLDQVAMAVRASSLNIPGGKLQTKGEQIRIRTLGRAYTPEDFANIIVMALPTGGTVTLGQIAEIKDFYQENQIVAQLNGKQAISLRIMKTREQDTITIDKEVKEYVASMQEKLPPGVDMQVWGETASILENRINLLLRNGLTGLFVVFLSLWMFLDLRLSFWTGMGIPISLAGSFMIMMFLGMTINMVTLFAMIMVLGIIVDDAIVVGESIYFHRKNGAPPLRAAIEGVAEVGMPVFAAVTTTIIAFLPLLFVSGWMGKLIFPMPVVVIVALFVSLLESLFLLPAHLNNLPDMQTDATNRNWIVRLGRRFHRMTNGGMERFAEKVYSPFIRFMVNWRYMGMGLIFIFIMLTFGFINSGILKMEFFEPPDSNSISATIEFEDNMTTEQVRAGVRHVEEALHQVAQRMPTASGAPLVKFVYTITGTSFNLPGEPDKGPNSGSVVVDFLDSSERGISIKDIIPVWEEEVGVLPGAVSLVFSRIDGELPGDPLAIWLLGNDLGHLHAAAEEISEKLGSYEGVYQVRHNFRPGKNELKLRLKPEAQTLGITVADLGRQVYAGYFGEEALQLQRGLDSVRVRVRYPESERNQISDFEKIRIKTPYGYEVPLRSVADIEVAPGFSVIKRVNGMRLVQIAAEVNTNFANAAEIVSDLENHFLPQLLAAYPGLSYEMKGDAENMDDTFGALRIGGPLSLLGIYIIIATLFRSYIQPLLILMTVPLGAIGACYGHLLLGYNLTVMSIFGMVALAGVVVNDAIVYIERVNENLAEGMNFKDAICLGGVRRFRAIMLTTISTVAGLGPIIIETDIHTRFLIPMAISLAAGVVFATALTLIYIPCLMTILNDARCFIAYLRTGAWPTREEVEPASNRRKEQEILEQELADIKDSFSVPHKEVQT